MAAATKCKVKDRLVNQLITLNDSVNTLSPNLVHSEQEQTEVQERREKLYLEIKEHRAKGHSGKPCPAVKRAPYNVGKEKNSGALLTTRTHESH